MKVMEEEHQSEMSLAGTVEVIFTQRIVNAEWMQDCHASQRFFCSGMLIIFAGRFR
jgi:hypothetical protein